jgi:hypothetical protein
LATVDQMRNHDARAHIEVQPTKFSTGGVPSPHRGSSAVAKRDSISHLGAAGDDLLRRPPEPFGGVSIVAVQRCWAPFLFRTSADVGLVLQVRSRLSRFLMRRWRSVGTWPRSTMRAARRSFLSSFAEQRQGPHRAERRDDFVRYATRDCQASAPCCPYRLRVWPPPGAGFCRSG